MAAKSKSNSKSKKKAGAGQGNKRSGGAERAPTASAAAPAERVSTSTPVFGLGLLLLAVSAVASLMLALQGLGSLNLPGCGFESDCARAAESVWGTIPGVAWLTTANIGLEHPEPRRCVRHLACPLPERVRLIEGIQIDIGYGGPVLTQDGALNHSALIELDRDRRILSCKKHASGTGLAPIVEVRGHVEPIAAGGIQLAPQTGAAVVVVDPIATVDILHVDPRKLYLAPGRWCQHDVLFGQLDHTDSVNAFQAPDGIGESTILVVG